MKKYIMPSAQVVKLNNETLMDATSIVVDPNTTTSGNYTKRSLIDLDDEEE